MDARWGYSQFNGSSDYCDGARFCQRGDVVVVTLNHRLNLFGYLYLAERAGDRFADSGNNRPAPPHRGAAVGAAGALIAFAHTGSP